MLTDQSSLIQQKKKLKHFTKNNLDKVEVNPNLFNDAQHYKESLYEYKQILKSIGLKNLAVSKPWMIGNTHQKKKTNKQKVQEDSDYSEENMQLQINQNEESLSQENQNQNNSDVHEVEHIKSIIKKNQNSAQKQKKHITFNIQSQENESINKEILQNQNSQENESNNKEKIFKINQNKQIYENYKQKMDFIHEQEQKQINKLTNNHFQQYENDNNNQNLYKNAINLQNGFYNTPINEFSYPGFYTQQPNIQTQFQNYNKNQEYNEVQSLQELNKNLKKRKLSTNSPLFPKNYNKDEPNTEKKVKISNNNQQQQGLQQQSSQQSQQYQLQQQSSLQHLQEEQKQNEHTKKRKMSMEQLPIQIQKQFQGNNYDCLQQETQQNNENKQQNLAKKKFLNRKESINIIQSYQQQLNPNMNNQQIKDLAEIEIDKYNLEILQQQKEELKLKEEQKLQNSKKRKNSIANNSHKIQKSKSPSQEKPKINQNNNNKNKNNIITQDNNNMQNPLNSQLNMNINANNLNILKIDTNLNSSNSFINKQKTSEKRIQKKETPRKRKIQIKISVDQDDKINDQDSESISPVYQPKKKKQTFNNQNIESSDSLN